LETNVTGLPLRLRRAARKLAWRALRGGPGRRPRILTVPTANGLLSFSNMDVLNAKGLFVQREWEIDLIRRSVAYLESAGYGRPSGADVLVDAGANIGMICIAMLREGFFREALAFEPYPDHIALLTRNIEQNGLAERIRPFPCALSDAEGEAAIELSEINAGDHRLRADRPRTEARMGEEARRTLRVPRRALDEVLDSDPAVDPSRIGLIWIDVQGHEGHLFRGAARTIARGVPVVTEFWPYGILRSGLDRDAYVEIVRSLFDRVIVINPPGNATETLDAAAVSRLFDEAPRPEQHLELILLPRSKR